MERGLDPLKTNLVVADQSRTEKTICLAVSPSLKDYGIPGRPRLFEVVQRLKEVNAERRCQAPDGRFAGSSSDADELADSPELSVSYITAPPRMAYYIEYSTKVYDIYLKYIDTIGFAPAYHWVSCWRRRRNLALAVTATITATVVSML